MERPTENKYGNENNSPVIELTENDFDGTTLKSDIFKNKYTLLKIYAPWCGYCVRMSKVMNFLAKELPKRNIQVATINYEKNKELAGKIGYQGFPTMFIVDKKGKLHETQMGSRSLMEILVAIKFKTLSLEKEL